MYIIILFLPLKVVSCFPNSAKTSFGGKNRRASDCWFYLG